MEYKDGDIISIKLCKEYSYIVPAEHYSTNIVGVISARILVASGHDMINRILIELSSSIGGWLFNKDHLYNFNNKQDHDNLIGKYCWWYSIPEIVVPKPTNAQVISSSLRCHHCGEANDYAQPNMKDGSFWCYSCRTNPWR